MGPFSIKSDGDWIRDILCCKTFLHCGKPNAQIDHSANACVTDRRDAVCARCDIYDRCAVREARQNRLKQSSQYWYAQAPPLMRGKDMIVPSNIFLIRDYHRYGEEIPCRVELRLFMILTGSRVHYSENNTDRGIADDESPLEFHRCLITCYRHTRWRASSHIEMHLLLLLSSPLSVAFLSAAYVRKMRMSGFIV